MTEAAAQEQTASEQIDGKIASLGTGAAPRSPASAASSESPMPILSKR